MSIKKGVTATYHFSILTRNIKIKAITITVKARNNPVNLSWAKCIGFTHWVQPRSVTGGMDSAKRVTGVKSKVCKGTLGRIDTSKSGANSKMIIWAVKDRCQWALSINWLIDPVTDWSPGWLIDRLLAWLTNWLIHQLTDWLIHRLIDRLTDWSIDWLIDRLIDRLTD